MLQVQRKVGSKKGQDPINYMPVGSIRKNGEGYYDIKVADPSEWKAMHVNLWESHHGKVPEGHVVIFLDGDKENITMDNLEMLPRSVHAMMCKYNLYSNNDEKTKASIAFAKLELEINKAKVQGNDKEEYRHYLELAKRNGINKTNFISRRKRGWSLEKSATRPLGRWRRADEKVSSLHKGTN